MFSATPVTVALAFALLACARPSVDAARAESSELGTDPSHEEPSMDWFELVRTRHSTRVFDDRNVTDQELRRLLESTNRAPSAGNLQAFEVVVVRERHRQKELADAAYGQSSVREAPLVLVFLANPARSRDKYGTRGAELFCLQDATIAASYAQLAAHALGLGSVWIGAFDDAAVARAVGATEALRPSSLLAIGHPGETPVETTRRSLRDLVHDERLGRHTLGPDIAP